jgi:hypothetical protein
MPICERTKAIFPTKFVMNRIFTRGSPPKGVECMLMGAFLNNKKPFNKIEIKISSYPKARLE